MKITANMATFPTRLDTCLQVVDSLYDQVDEIRIYLNKYSTVPKELLDKKIKTVLGKDLQSSGKLFWAMRRGEYYFCVDDDILYPADYVRYTLDKLDQYSNDVIVSHHGRLFTPNKKVKNYFLDYREYYHFKEKKVGDTEVEVIGNGVSCWNTDKIRIDLTKFKYYFMDDIYVSWQAHQQGKKRIVIEHGENYLKPLPQDEKSTLYSKYRNRSNVQTQIFNSINWWKAIR